MPHNNPDFEEIDIEENDISQTEGGTTKGKEAKQMYKLLDGIGMRLAATRSEAIEGRQNTGIEEEWLEDEEYYEGIDDANRNELKAWRGKPLGSQAPLDDDEDQTGSTIFLNITRPYCDAVAARMGDMLLPIDDLSFKIAPTPQPELINLSKGKISSAIKKEINDTITDPEKRQTMMDGAIEDAKNILEVTNESAKKAETQIWDWHRESQYHSQNRRLIEDAAKVGTGVLKGPIPAKKTKMVFKGGKIQMVEEIKPVSTRILYRNLYPDPACGEDIHRGNYTWERDDITRSALQKLIDLPGYITPQIAKVIHEGPTEAKKEFRHDMDNPGLKVSHDARKSLFEIWYYYGSMKRSDLMCCELMSERIDPDDYTSKDMDEYVYVQVTMVNNRVIRATVSHLQTGDFPYDLMVWQRRMGLPWGMGVARQVRPAQRIVVGAMRHMMDNAGVAGGPMLYIDTNLVQAADSVNEVKPWKVFIAADDADQYQVNNAREGIQFIAPPIMQEELQAIIELGLKIAEDVTGLPLIMQGQTNQRTPSTLGGMNIQNNNASTVLRRVVKLYDDLVTEPHIRRYYNHILQYGKDDSMKGEFSVIALGSSSLIERDMANDAVMQMGEHVMNPVFGKDPRKWLDEMLKINKLDPTRFDYEDEEWQKIVENMSQPQETDNRLEVEQMKQEGAQKLAEFRAQADQQMLQMKEKFASDLKEKELSFKLSELTAKVQMDDKQKQITISIAEMSGDLDIQLAQLKEAGDDKRKLEDVKQKLQDTVMKLKTQISLSGTEVITPAVEPRGRAPDGQSFEK